MEGNEVRPRIRPIADAVRNHGVPILYVAVAAVFAITVRWERDAERIYDDTVRILLDEQITTREAMEASLAPILRSSQEIRSNNSNSIVIRYLLVMPSCLNILVEYDQPTNAINNERLYFFGTHQVQPDASGHHPSHLGFDTYAILVYPILAIAVWYSARKARSPRVGISLRWVAGLMLVPAGLYISMHAVTYYMCSVITAR